MKFKQNTYYGVPRDFGSIRVVFAHWQEMKSHLKRNQNEMINFAVFLKETKKLNTLNWAWNQSLKCCHYSEHKLNVNELHFRAETEREKWTSKYLLDF